MCRVGVGEGGAQCRLPELGGRMVVGDLTQVMVLTVVALWAGAPSHCWRWIASCLCYAEFDNHHGLHDLRHMRHMCVPYAGYVRATCVACAPPPAGVGHLPGGGEAHPGGRDLHQCGCMQRASCVCVRMCVCVCVCAPPAGV